MNRTSIKMSFKDIKNKKLNLFQLKKTLINKLQNKFSCSDPLQFGYTCNKCVFKTHEKLQLREHICGLAWPPQFNPYSMKCEKCDIHSYSHLVFFKHYKKCSFCRNMIRNQLKNIEWLECDKCMFKCENKQGLDDHEIARHTANEALKWYKCNLCVYETKFIRELSRHITSKHIKIANTNYFQCDKCEYKADKFSSWRDHQIIIHTPTENTEWFKCGFCSYKAKIAAALKAHVIRKHASESTKAAVIVNGEVFLV